MVSLVSTGVTPCFSDGRVSRGSCSDATRAISRRRTWKLPRQLPGCQLATAVRVIPLHQWEGYRQQLRSDVQLLLVHMSMERDDFTPAEQIVIQHALQHWW